VELAADTEKMKLITKNDIVIGSPGSHMIVPLVPLVKDLKCKISADDKDRIKLTHPRRGNIVLDQRSGCPLMEEDTCRTLIQEHEEDPSWWAIKEEEVSREPSDEGYKEEETSGEASATETVRDEEEDDSEDKTPDFILRLIHDSWQGPNKKGEVYHLNKTGRKCKLDKKREACPVSINELDEKRVTVKTKSGKSTREEDDWTKESELDEETWAGLTAFYMKKSPNEEVEEN